MTECLKELPGPRMIFIEGGTYQRGWLFGKVLNFYMDETPVTVAQYREAVNAGACSPPRNKLLSSIYSKHKKNYWVEGREDHPINCVNWHQAKAYADWAGKRLPTEEEWEWAARGGDEGRMYPWGNEAPSDQLCWDGEGNDLGWGQRKGTSPVGSYPKGNSKHGIKDLVGNVYEWTAIAILDMTNHTIYSHVKGGCYDSMHSSLLFCENYRMEARICSSPILGFRCVKSFEP